MGYEFKLPDLGEGVREGEIARWLVEVGQEIAEDDPLVEIQTDKTTVEIPSPAAGKVASILVEEGKVNLLIDLKGVGFLDSSGLGALVRALTSAQKEGGQTKLLHAGPQIRKLLEMTKLDSVFELHEDRETAVSSF